MAAHCTTLPNERAAPRRGSGLRQRSGPAAVSCTGRPLGPFDQKIGALVGTNPGGSEMSATMSQRTLTNVVASSRARAAPGQMWGPFPNARCCRAFSRPRMNFVAVVKVGRISVG